MQPKEGRSYGASHVTPTRDENPVVPDKRSDASALTPGLSSKCRGYDRISGFCIILNQW